MIKNLNWRGEIILDINRLLNGHFQLMFSVDTDIMYEKINDKFIELG